MVASKITNEAGWKRLTDSQFSKRHFFAENEDQSLCGGALLSEEKCKEPSERVEDNADGNCGKCLRHLKDNPDLKKGAPAPSKSKKPVVDPDQVSSKTIEDTKKMVSKPEKEKPPKEEPKKGSKAQVEKATKPDTKDKQSPEKPAEKKPSVQKTEKTEKVEKPAKPEVEKPPKKEKVVKPPKEPKPPKTPKEPKIRAGVPSQSITQFTTIEEMVVVAKTLDKAEVRSLVAAKSVIESDRGNKDVASVSGGNIIEPRAIWNLSRDRLSSIVSDDYSLVQHRDVLTLVGKGLTAIGTDVYGTVKNIEDVLVVEVFFPKLHLKDDAKGIDVGGKIINSYNKTRAFKGHMMAQRKVCTNGMYLRKLIPDVEFFEIHVGDLSEKIPEMVQEFFEQLKASTSKVNDIIKVAMETSIEFDTIDQVEPTIAGILSSPMHAKRIVDEYYKAENQLTPTVWELYNSITAYISHANLVESRVDDLSNKVEKLLDTNYSIEILDPETDEETSDKKVSK